MRHLEHLLLAVLLVMALAGCGDKAADEAFREVQGIWRLDPKASFEATMDGNLVASMLPTKELESAFEGSGRWPDLMLRIYPDGRVRLLNEDYGRAFKGRIEDTGKSFLARFLHDAQDDPAISEDVDALTRVTFELVPREDRLHVRIVGADAEGVTEGGLAMLQQMGILHWARLVFVAP